MEINEWMAKARLLEVGEALYVSCISSTEAFKSAGKFDTLIRQGGYNNYTLISYAKPNNKDNSWWVVIAKVKRTDKAYLKKADGSMVEESDIWVTVEAQRIFRVAINDGKSLNEIMALAVTEMEKRYISELWSTTIGNVVNFGK